MFLPTSCNTCHPDFDEWNGWSMYHIEELFRRYYGISHLNEEVIEKFKECCRAVSDDLFNIHSKAFKLEFDKDVIFIRHQYNWWVERVLENCVCRYNSQGGTDYSNILPWMIPRLNATFKQLGPETEEIYKKIKGILKN